jgi:aldose 1-epimerase
MENKAGNKRFQVLHEKLGNQQLLKLIDSNTNEFVSILPEMGGMLHSMELLINNALVHIVDSYKSDTEAKETLWTSFKGCHLFPFPNRIANGVYEFEGKSHELDITFPNENNAIHGLILEEPFKVIDSKASDKAASVKLGYESNGKLRGYPYLFKLEVEFTLEEQKGLTITTTFTNKHTSEIPVGDGWHPYFQLKSNVNDLIFSFPSKLIFEVNDRMIPTGKSSDYTEFVKPKQIKDTAFDTCFALDNKADKAVIIIEDPALHGGIKIWQETGAEKFNYLQVYTPPTRKTLAIEPMTCIPDAFNNHIGLIKLKPGKSVSVSWGVSSF